MSIIEFYKYLYMKVFVCDSNVRDDYVNEPSLFTHLIHL